MKSWSHFPEIWLFSNYFLRGVYSYFLGTTKFPEYKPSVPWGTNWIAPSDSKASTSAEMAGSIGL